MSTYQEMLRRRKDRACAVLLSFKEREVDRHVPADVSDRLRKAILDQLNDVHMVAHDIISSLEGDGVVYNEMFLERFNTLYETVVNGHAGSVPSKPS